MKLLRSLLLAILAASLVGACASRKPRSRAQIYEGDSTPGISMHEEAPGLPPTQ